MSTLKINICFLNISSLDGIISCSYFYRKIHCLTSEFHVKFHARNRYEEIAKFNVKFTRQAVNFSIVLGHLKYLKQISPHFRLTMLNFTTLSRKTAAWKVGNIKHCSGEEVVGA